MAPGCIQQERTARPPRFVTVPPAAPATQPSPSAPLPGGWASPFDLRNAAAALTQPGIVRPLDLSQLIAAAGRGPCAPSEVAPHVWFAPDCSGNSRPSVTSSPFVQKRGLTSSSSALPSEVDLRRQGLDGPVKYQQMVGVCWAFAISTAMDNALRRAGSKDVVAPMHVLAADPWRDIWNKGHSSKALTSEPIWPYDPVKACKLNESPSEVWCEKAYHVRPGSWRSDPSLVEEVARANQSGVYAITHVESVRTTDTTQIAAALASGHSLYAGFDYNKAAWGALGTGGAVIPDYERGEGGHAVVIVGYRSTQNGRQFLLHNSWGTEWRDGGYAWISEAMVRRHLQEAVTIEVSAPLGNARPSARPAADARVCVPGQARDTVFGWCVVDDNYPCRVVWLTPGTRRAAHRPGLARAPRPPESGVRAAVVVELRQTTGSTRTEVRARSPQPPSPASSPQASWLAPRGRKGRLERQTLERSGSRNRTGQRTCRSGSRTRNHLP